ncbi:DNA replication factor CDT1 like protein, partial [Ostertagia ostertagi]
VTRGRGRTQKKLHGDEARVETKSFQAPGLKKESTQEDCLSAKAESVCSPPKRAKKVWFGIERSARKVLFAADDTLKSSPKKEIDVEVPSSTNKDSGAITCVSEAVKAEASAEIEPCDALSPAKDPLISRADELSEKLALKAAQTKLRARIRSVADLQAVLAQKGAVRAVHEQAQKIKSKQRMKPSTSAVPDFVLPTHKTPAKKSLDEFELHETRHVFEYGKASRLIEEVKRNSTLPLPRQYEHLHETFQSCDRVVSIYTNQGRRCAVLEIQKNVEKNTHLSFTRKHLAQIVQVYPTSYDVRLDKRWNAFGGDAEVIRKDGISNGSQSCRWDPVLDARPRLEGWRMICRSHVFRHKLVEIAKKFHQKFLERLGLNLKEVELARLRRFHPKFDLEQECGEIEQAELPEVDHGAAERHLEMKDYLATVDTTVPLPKAVSAALEDLKSPLKKLVSSNAAVPLSPRKFAEKQASKPKGAMSLLERIRAKEAERKAAEKLRDPVIDRKIELLQRILHGLLRCITTYFAFKKVRSMELRTRGSESGHEEASPANEFERALIPTPALFAYIRFEQEMKENNYTAIEKVIQEELARLRTSAPSASQLQQGVAVADVAKKAVRALF